MSQTLQDFQHLWTVDRDHYRLLPSRRGGGEYVIFNKTNGTMELIDDDLLQAAVVRKMLEAGVPVEHPR